MQSEMLSSDQTTAQRNRAGSANEEGVVSRTRGLLTKSLLAAALLTSSAPAQTTAWSEVQPAGGVPPGSVSSIGKLTHFVDGSVLHVWSAFTRRWHQLNVGTNASVRQTNDWLLVQEGNIWTAFAAAGGRFVPLTTSAGAFVLNPTSQNNDSVLIIRDGGQVHAFSGFLGRWVSRNISPTATVTVRRHTALLSTALPAGAGSILGGFSAFTGSWHDMPIAQPVISLSADGTAGVAESATELFGFSSRLGTWATTPSLVHTTRARDDDWASWYDGVNALAFSGLSGTFATQAIGPASVQHTESLYVLYRTTQATHAYSAVTGSWASVSTSPSATTRGANAVALIEEPLLLTAYSAPLGAFVSINLDATATSLAGSVVAATERNSGMPTLFSALTGNWQAAPGDATPTLPQVGFVSALLPRPGGHYAFSTRTGLFVPLNSPGGIAEIGPQTAPALVWDPTALHFFDARRDLWISEPRPGSGQPAVHMWRTTAMVFDGSDVVGFGSQNGHVERLTLTEPVAAFRANSESLTVTTSARVLGFSGLGQPNTLSQFPEFLRVFPIGGVLNVQLPMQSGDLAIIAGGLLATQPSLVPGLGTLLLDTQTLTSMLVLPRTDADRGELLLPVPNLPALRGAQFWFQALLAPLNAAPVLTTGCEVWVG